MQPTYGVVWRVGAEPLARGKLELLPLAVRLDGLSGSEPVALEIPYDELEDVRTGRTAADRLNGQPTLVLEQRGHETVVIAAVAQSGVVSELTQHLSKLARA
jgi:hypothetical protein